MRFDLQKADDSSGARAGTIHTDHGTIETPVFMPVGTAGTVKGIHQKDLKEEIDARIILGNTYHLYLRPGTDILVKAGGLHRFMSWDRPILTDSGGYQVYSLSQIRKITSEGVHFQSHIDGSMHTFTPEKVVDIQRMIGADIIMGFDECTPYPCEYAYARKSLDITHDWLKRSVTQFGNTESLYGHTQSLFPIVQGSTFRDLRLQSAEFVASLYQDGNAIGGLSVGEPSEIMYEMVETVNAVLPKNKPRYLMGVGTPADLLECIARGIDMFDCVLPTRNGRNGMLFTSEGIINIKNEKWRDDLSLIDPLGISFVDRTCSKAYLRHLVISKEMLGAQIASIHNISFYLWLVSNARKQILNGNFVSWKNETLRKVSQRI